MDQIVSQQRRRGRKARRAQRLEEQPSRAVEPGLMGGAYKPLATSDIERIHATALDVLENLGMANPLPILRDHALARGCTIDDKGRLHFPRGLVEDVVADAARGFVLEARDPRYDCDLSSTRVHFATGGEAVTVPDFETGQYRPSTVVDLYDLARLADRLEHIHIFSSVVVPTNIESVREQDLGAVYACVSGTAKHSFIGFSNGEHVEDVYAMLYDIAGGEDAFRKRPFISSGGCPVVSPLGYGDDNSLSCLETARMGGVASIVMAPQAGATSPAALAGTLVQSTAETLAGLLLVNLVYPGHPVIFGNWPFVSDLRTGAFSGGGGEEAVLNAAAAQIANFYDLPSSVGAGMTDSKACDNQAGYEKGVTNALAALAGANMVAEAPGMLGSLMACSFEAMVIDNDMLGCIQRALRGIEVTDETLSYDVIAEAVDGPGHYLGHVQTLDLMETEYLYPDIGDRSSPDEWAEKGAPDIRDVARERVRDILSSHYPDYIDDATDTKLRERFPIALPRDAMRASCGRW
jgi:trimethylamine--corrinoid protein Co-methyltransferase